MTLLESATAFAIYAHRGQVRKGPVRLPYITHPLDVLRRLQRHGVTAEHTLAAAVLHDVVEDCEVSVETLETLFGELVASIVEEVSDPPGLTKKEARARQVAKAPTMSLGAQLIKLADKASNLRDVVINAPGWSPAVIAAYGRSSRAVIEAIGPVNRGLYDEALAAADVVLG